MVVSSTSGSVAVANFQGRIQAGSRLSVHAVRICPSGWGVDHAAAVALNTSLNLDLPRGIELDTLYRLVVVVTNFGNTSHHLLSVLSFDIWGPLDLDVSLTWDRTQDPVPDQDGNRPVPDDLRLSLGLGIDF